MADPTGNVLPVKPTTITVTCDTDLSAKQGYAVTYDATDPQNVNLAADAAAVHYPVVEGQAGATGAKKSMTIAIGGHCEVKLGGTVAPGDFLAATTDGRWIKTVTAGDHYGAIANDTGVANDLITAQVVQGMVSEAGA